MTQIEQIKAEIERRIKERATSPSDGGEMDAINGARCVELTSLLRFIDTLPEEKPSEGLEKATKDYLKVLALTPYNNTPITNAQVVCKELLVFLKEPRNYNPNKISAGPSEDLEQEIEKYWIEEGGGSHAQFDRYKKVAEHFAKWQKEKMQKANGWHSVDESLPPMGEEVIALTDVMNGKHLDSARHICFAHMVDKRYAVDYNGWNIDGVKYWMYRPNLDTLK